MHASSGASESGDGPESSGSARVEFSIVTATLGEARFLPQAIASVERQQEVSVEHLIVTDRDFPPANRTPRQSNLPAKWAPLPAASVQLLTDESSGAASAINHGMSMARGEFIGWLDDDDVLLEHGLKRVADEFRSHPDIDILYGSSELIDEDGTAYEHRRSREVTRRRLGKGDPIRYPAFFFRRGVLDRVGRLRTDLQSQFRYEFVIRCLLAGCRFQQLPIRLGAKRRHRDNRNFGNRDADHCEHCSREKLQVCFDHFGNMPVRMALSHGSTLACIKGLEKQTSLRYDATVLKAAFHAMQEYDHDTRLNRLVLFGRHVTRELGHCVKYPRSLVRVVPMAGPLCREVLRSRLFQLYQHPPRALFLPTPAPAFQSDDPLTISIVTPNLNQADYIERTIKSVLDQGYPRLQYVIQDGESTDGSLEIIEKYAPRLHAWKSAADGGQTNAINAGMRMTSGEVMAYLNSDDILLPGSLAFVSDYFQQNADVDVIYGHRIIVDQQDREVGRWILPQHDNNAIAYADFIPQETMFWRRRAWEAVDSRLDERFQFAMDWDLILRFRQAGLRFVRVPEFLAAFRVMESQKTQTLLETLGQTEMNRLRMREFGKLPGRAEMRRALSGYRLRQWVCNHVHNLTRSNHGQTLSTEVTHDTFLGNPTGERHRAA